MAENMENNNHIETVTIDTEISMSLAATDETPDAVRQRPGRYNDYRRRGLRDGTVLTDSGLMDASPPKHFFPRVSINVEPTLFLLSVSLGLLTTMQSPFLYWSRCCEMFSNTSSLPENVYNVTSFCAHLSTRNYTVYQNRLEKDISTTKTLLQVASSVPTLITAPVIAAWSDGRGGRRRPLLMALTGLTGYMCLQFASTLSYVTVNVYYFMFAAEAFVGCLGGIATLFMASLAIVTDESRGQLVPGSSGIPMRIALASAVQSVGFLVGNLVASMCTVSATVSIRAHTEGYIRAFAIAFGVAVFALLYSILFVRETHATRETELETSFTVGDRFSLSSQSSGHSQRKSLVKFVRALVYDLVSVAIERRPGWTRLCLNLSICFVFVEFLALDNQLLFLLVKRYPFDWSDTTFANYSTLKSFLSSLGMALAPLLVAKSSCLGKDSLLIMVGILASSGQFILNSLAQSSSLIFAACSCSLLAGAIAPGYRSFLPRMVAKEETARLFAAFSIFVIASPIVSAAIFNSIFNATIDVWPGFAFFLGGLLQVFVFAGQFVIHCLMRPQWEAAAREERSRGSTAGRSEGDNDWATESRRRDSERSVSNTAVNSESDSVIPFDEPSRPLLV